MRHGRGFVRAAFSFAKFAASGKVQAKKNLGLMQLIKKVGEEKAIAMLEKSEHAANWVAGQTKCN